MVFINNKFNYLELNTMLFDFDCIDLKTLRQYYCHFITTHAYKFNSLLMQLLFVSWIDENLDESLSKQLSYASKLQILENFVCNHMGTLVVYDLSPKDRYEFHRLCAMLGLEHMSVKTPSSINKDIWIVKPTNWCWEFTQISPLQYQLNTLYAQKRSMKKNRIAQ